MKPCNFVKSKSDALLFFQDKIQNITRDEVFNAKSCFLKKHEKCQICRFHGVKWTKTWFFEWKHFFRNLTCRKMFNSNSNVMHFFSLQNLTSCKTFESKSDAFFFKIWHIVNFYFKVCFSNQIFRFSLIIIKVQTKSKNNLLDNDDGLRCGLCLSHVWYFFFGYYFLNGKWVRDWCDDYITCTIKWPI